MTRRSIEQLLDEARLRLARLAPSAAYDAMLAGATLVDVRTGEQLDHDGRIPGALTIPLNVLEWRLDPDSSSRHSRAPNLDDRAIIICNQGYCSSLAAARLQDLGFAGATDVIGGFERWRAEGLPVAGIPIHHPIHHSGALPADPVVRVGEGWDAAMRSVPRHSSAG